MMQTLMTAMVVAMTGSAGGPPADLVDVQARMPARIEVGAEASIELEIEFAEAWSSSEAGIPEPLVQLEVPDSVELTGRRLTSYRELAGNEFLREPFERVVEPGRSSIGFRLVDEPGAGEVIGISVIAYVRAPDGEDAHFVRRRVDLPVRAGASGRAERAQAERSDWGVRDVLQIGDKAAGFELPRADGSTLSLDEALAQGDVVITTYRAFW